MRGKDLPRSGRGWIENQEKAGRLLKPALSLAVKSGFLQGSVGGRMGLWEPMEHDVQTEEEGSVNTACLPILGLSLSAGDKGIPPHTP